MWNQLFDGYCPESRLEGEKVRMRLNSHDFFESEKTGLQIAISYPGVHAVVLKFRGKGDFRRTVTYADEVENGELLSPQLVERFPYCGDELFRNEVEFRNYLDEEVDGLLKKHNYKVRSALTHEDFERCWLGFFFNLKEGYMIAAVKRAYRDFNRTIEKMPKMEMKKGLLRNKWLIEMMRILNYILITDFSNQKEFDDWHEMSCKELAQANEELILTIGQAQKWINMSLKYLFLMGEKYIEGINRNYQFFHIPIDGIIQNVLKDQFGISKVSETWSKIFTYSDYLDYQKEVRRAFANEIPMDVEFGLFIDAYSR